jgi:fatty acid desaturase
VFAAAAVVDLLVGAEVEDSACVISVALVAASVVVVVLALAVVVAVVSVLATVVLVVVIFIAVVVVGPCEPEVDRIHAREIPGQERPEMESDANSDTVCPTWTSS